MGCLGSGCGFEDVAVLYCHVFSRMDPEAEDDPRWKEYQLKKHSVTLEGNFDMNTRKDLLVDLVDLVALLAVS